MSKVFFKLQKQGLTDYDLTPWLDIQNYAVNAVPVYNEWMDANYRLHRHYVRDRVGGSFALGFAKKADFDAFLAALSTYQTDGVYTVSAYVNANGSADGVASLEVYLTTEGAGKWDVKNGRQWLTVTVTVEEL